jgi:hypothetical protein
MPRRPFEVKPLQPGARIEWRQLSATREHVTRAGTVWSLAPGSAQLVVIPDELYADEAAVVLRVGKWERQIGQPQYVRSISREWQRTAVRRADAIAAAGALIQTYREERSYGEHVITRVITHVPDCPQTAAANIVGGGEFYAIRHYIRHALGEMPGGPTPHWCDTCLGAGDGPARQASSAGAAA